MTAACALCHHECREPQPPEWAVATLESLPPTVIELAPDEVRELAADFMLAARRRERVRVMIDGDEGLKVSWNRGRWSVGFGTVQR